MIEFEENSLTTKATMEVDNVLLAAMVDREMMRRIADCLRPGLSGSATNLQHLRTDLNTRTDALGITIALGRFFKIDVTKEDIKYLL